MNGVLPTPIPNRPLDAARMAVADLTEPQRLALATELVAGAGLPVSVQQLRRCALAATVAADSLEKLAFAERAMRRAEGPVVNALAGHDPVGTAWRGIAARIQELT